MRRALLATAGAAAVGLACRGTLLTRFDHRQHLAELKCAEPGQPACLTCTSCHVGAQAAHGPGSCTTCHPDGDQKWRRAVRPALAVAPAGKSIIFEHDTHLALPEVKGQCVHCHAGAVGLQSGPPLFPPMATCTGCHRHRAQFEANQCEGCHRRRELSALKPVTFLSHDVAWMRRHADEARASQAGCTTCHAQTQCDGCHDATRRLGPHAAYPEKIDSSLVHRFDFVSRHALEATSQPGSCFSCHTRTECDGCHASRGVSGAVRAALSPHPLGWASGLTSNTHGPAARRDIASCAACHDHGAQSSCVRCHAPGGLGGSPHPGGWRSLSSRSSPQCAACHEGGR